MRAWARRLSHAQVALIWLVALSVVGACMWKRAQQLERITAKRALAESEVATAVRDTLRTAVLFNDAASELEIGAQYYKETGRRRWSPYKDSILAQQVETWRANLQLNRDVLERRQRQRDIALAEQPGVSTPAVVAASLAMLAVVLAVAWWRLSPASRRDSGTQLGGGGP